MAKVESQYIIFKKGIQFHLDFCSRGYDNKVIKAKFYASGEALSDEVVIEEIEVDHEFMKGLFLDYLSVKDLLPILDGIYNDVDGKSVIEEIVLEKIYKEADRWTINIEPYIRPNHTTPERSELEYKVKKVQTPMRKFDLDDIGGTDDNILISSEIMDQFIESYNKKELDAAFYDKYMDEISRHPERYE